MILEVFSRAINFHVKQGLPLRGYRNPTRKSLGHFHEYLKEISIYCSELIEHLETPQKKNVASRSLFSKNEVVQIIGKKIIL